MLPEPKAPETPSSFKSIPLSRDLSAWRYPPTTYPLINRVGGGPMFDEDGNWIPNE
jgi:hypothetical protein